MADDGFSIPRMFEGALSPSPPQPGGILDQSSAGIGLAGLLRAPQPAPSLGGLAELLRAPQSKICDSSEEAIRRLLIWEKGIPIRGYDPAEWRLDKHGFTIQFSQHGRRDSAFGWEVDHIVPESWGGSDEIRNLQPVYWRVNAHKSNRFTG